MKLILIFMLMTSGWVSIAGTLSNAVKRTSFESEARIRYELQVGQEDAFQFMYRNKLVYNPYRNVKWTFGIGTNPANSLSRYINLEKNYLRFETIGIDTLNVELNLLSSRLKVRSGLMEVPYDRGVSSSVLFDPDLRLQGLHLAYSKRKRSQYRVHVDASILSSKNNKSSDSQEDMVLASLQAQYAKRLMRQQVTAGAGAHSFLRREKGKVYLKDFLTDEESRDSFGEVFAKVGLRKFPATVYGSLIFSSLENTENSDLNYFAGLEYKFNSKVLLNYVFANITQSLSYASSQIMDSNIINNTLRFRVEDVQAHSLSVVYKLKRNQVLKGQFVLRDVKKEASKNKSFHSSTKTVYLSWIAPF